MDLPEDLFGDFVPEEGGDLDSIECKKKCGHKNLIPVLDFKLEDIPEDYREEETFEGIKIWADLTVKAIVKYVSRSRPQTYAGTAAKFPNSHLLGSRRKVTPGSGYIHSIPALEDIDTSKDCPCLQCQQEEGPSQQHCWYFIVVTSIHVVFDSSEAERSIFECFYDSDKTRSETVRRLYGISTYPQTSCDNEKMSFVLCVTHDEDLSTRLFELVKRREQFVRKAVAASTGPTVLISHPHGCSKRISCGRALYFTVPPGLQHNYPVNQPVRFEEETECILPYELLSQAPVAELAEAHGVVHPGELQQSEETDTCCTFHGAAASDSVTETETDESESKSVQIQEVTSIVFGTDTDNTAFTPSPVPACSESVSPQLARQATDSTLIKTSLCPSNHSPSTYPDTDTDTSTDKRHSPGVCSISPGVHMQDRETSALLSLSLGSEENLESKEFISNTNSISDNPSSDPGEENSSPHLATLAGSSSFDSSDALKPDQTPIPDLKSENKSTSTFSIHTDPGHENCGATNDTESFSLHYIDGALEEGLAESVPPPHHLLSLDLPSKMTFTLPQDAKFARIYDDLKALFRLPPNTKFHLPGGKEVQLPVEALFYCNRVTLENGYMRYKVHSCPASSGGCLLLDGGNSFFNALPHGGSLPDGTSLCAMRCFPVLPSAV